MAISTNPKEYVQRRGRVLRRAKGKQFSVIYDFITLPRSLDSTEKYAMWIAKLHCLNVKKNGWTILSGFAKTPQNHINSLIKSTNTISQILQADMTMESLMGKILQSLAIGNEGSDETEINEKKVGSGLKKLSAVM